MQNFATFAELNPLFCNQGWVSFFVFCLFWGVFFFVCFMLVVDIGNVKTTDVRTNSGLQRINTVSGSLMVTKIKKKV